MNEEMKEPKNIVVNGKVYPLWQQFVQHKEEWIGGVVEDMGDPIDRAMGYTGATGKITDIKLEPNGKDSAMFEIVAEDFSCGFDVRYGGVIGGEPDWLTLSGPMNSLWRIKKP